MPWQFQSISGRLLWLLLLTGFKQISHALSPGRAKEMSGVKDFKKVDLLSQEIALLEEDIALSEQRMELLQDLRQELLRDNPNSPLLTEIPDVGKLIDMAPSDADPHSIAEDYLFEWFQTPADFAAILSLKNQRAHSQGSTVPSHLVIVADKTNVQLRTQEGVIVFREKHLGTKVTHLGASNGHESAFYFVVSMESSGYQVRTFRIKLNNVHLDKNRVNSEGVKISKYIDTLPLNITIHDTTVFPTKNAVSKVASVSDFVVVTSPTGIVDIYHRNGTIAMTENLCTSLLLLQPASDTGFVFTCPEEKMVGLVNARSRTTQFFNCDFKEPLSNLGGATLMAETTRHLLVPFAAGKTSLWKVTHDGSCAKQRDFGDLDMGPVALKVISKDYILASWPDGRVVYNRTGNVVWYMREKIAVDLYAERTSQGDLMVTLSKNGTVRVREVFLAPVVDESKQNDGFGFKAPVMGLAIMLAVGWQMTRRKDEMNRGRSQAGDMGKFGAMGDMGKFGNGSAMGGRGSGFGMNNSMGGRGAGLGMDSDLFNSSGGTELRRRLDRS